MLMVSENASLAELECLLAAETEPPPPPGHCPRTWDRVTCWPSSLPDSLVLLPCFPELNGVPYDTTQNASRWCHVNGSWAGYSNYSLCRVLEPKPEDQVVLSTTLYYAGYSLSLAALGVAVFIFLYFKELRCLRNSIHTNLMFTYILSNFMWIITATLQVSVQMGSFACIMLVLLLNYFHLTNFFWMFVEGLYLYMLVVETFTGRYMQMSGYLFIGWGAPFIITVAWGIAKGVTSGTGEPQTSVTDGGCDSVACVQVHSSEVLLTHCPWMNYDGYDWIHMGSIVLVLLANLAFLSRIMWVLITKLRSANTVETQQYRKASKALLVLIPLLGITYIVVITGPTSGISADVYAYVRCILLSTQGFTVALFYCFLNSEVQTTVRHRFNSWYTARSLGGRRRSGNRLRLNSHSGGRASKDWSPRSRTESIRYTRTAHSNTR